MKKGSTGRKLVLCHPVLSHKSNMYLIQKNTFKVIPCIHYSFLTSPFSRARKMVWLLCSQYLIMQCIPLFPGKYHKQAYMDAAEDDDYGNKSRKECKYNRYSTSLHRHDLSDWDSPKLPFNNSMHSFKVVLHIILPRLPSFCTVHLACMFSYGSVKLEISVAQWHTFFII